MTSPFIYLASQSPRRRELLAQIGLAHRVLQVDVPEVYEAAERPQDYVQRLSKAKAQAGFASVIARNDMVAPVLGADTIGVLDGRVLEKPRDRDDFMRMMSTMSGRSHSVLTAVTLCVPQASPLEVPLVETHVVETQVFFRATTAQELTEYWATGEPQDKAGGYGIQGLGAVFVEKILGSYTNVVGLPLETVAALCRQYNIEYWQASQRDE